MNLTVSGKQIDVGDSLRAHVERELVLAVEKYFGRAVEGSVVFSRDGYRFRTDVSVHIGRNILVQRFFVFVLGAVTLSLYWLWLALQVFG